MAKQKSGKTEPSLGRLGQYLGFRLRRVQNRFSRDFSHQTGSWKLRSGMFSALELIHANPGISQIALSAEVGLDKSAIVPVIDALEERGWIERARSTVDRRRYQLSVTSEGNRQLDALFAELDRTEAFGLAVLDEEEKRVVSRALDKIYHAYVRPAKTR